MDLHVGQLFAVRVVNKTTGAEVVRLVVPEVPASAFEFNFDTLEVGKSYRIDFYVERNGNDRYNPPPTDHAWRLEADTVVGDVTLEFTHNLEFTDIDWPPAIDGGIFEAEYRHTFNDPGTGIDVYWQNIVQGAGREEEGKTIIEFVIPLTSDDPNDLPLEPGSEVTIILAYHLSSDRLTARHTRRSTSSITLDEGSS